MEKILILTIFVGWSVFQLNLGRDYALLYEICQGTEEKLCVGVIDFQDSTFYRPIPEATARQALPYQPIIPRDIANTLNEPQNWVPLPGTRAINGFSFTEWEVNNPAKIKYQHAQGVDRAPFSVYCQTMTAEHPQLSVFFARLRWFFPLLTEPRGHEKSIVISADKQWNLVNKVAKPVGSSKQSSSNVTDKGEEHQCQRLWSVTSIQLTYDPGFLPTVHEILALPLLVEE
ncbi:MAG: hypothetical protein AAF828_09675 [Bacteroidota bacterium]